MFRDIDEKAVNVILIVRWWNTSIRLDRSINRISAISDLLLRFYERTLCIDFIVFCQIYHRSSLSYEKLFSLLCKKIDVNEC